MKEKTWLSSHVPHITAGLFLIQPVMDILSYWLQEWGISNLPTLVLRFGVLGFTMLSAGCYPSEKECITLPLA